MKILRVLSVLFLAAFLVFQGLFRFAEMPSPIIQAAMGLLSLGAGLLIFLSLGHWIDIHKEK